MDSAISGTLGNVLPGSLLGPIVGLTFSADGGLLFACSGSSLWVYHVRSGALLSTIRVFMPGVAVYGMDVGRESCEAVGVARGIVPLRVRQPPPYAKSQPRANRRVSRLRNSLEWQDMQCGRECCVSRPGR